MTDKSRRQQQQAEHQERMERLRKFHEAERLRFERFQREFGAWVAANDKGDGLYRKDGGDDVR